MKWIVNKLIMKKLLFLVIVSLLLTGACVRVKEYHVSKTGNDNNDGRPSRPFLTISKAASLAQPGDTITVHEGIYREHINPPRGGISDSKRIVYRAGPGESVVISGSELVKGWKNAMNDTWTITLPNDFFGGHINHGNKHGSLGIRIVINSGG